MIKALLQKYQHALLVISALLVITHLLIPLSEWQTEQQQRQLLLAKKQQKTKQLLANAEQLQQYTEVATQQIQQLMPWLYADKTAAAFKLNAQKKIEQAMLKAGCTIERIGFTGNQVIHQGLTRWLLEVRYKGEPLCLVNTTRAIESMQPLVNINYYNATHRRLTSAASGQVNAKIELSLWHIGGI
jgi:hypothetical protein